MTEQLLTVPQIDALRLVATGRRIVQSNRTTPDSIAAGTVDVLTRAGLVTTKPGSYHDEAGKPHTFWRVWLTAAGKALVTKLDAREARR